MDFEREKLFVVPAREGLLVPIPGRTRRHLPPEGAEVTRDAYWSRRIADGEVRVVTKATKAAKLSSAKEE